MGSYANLLAFFYRVNLLPFLFSGRWLSTRGQCLHSGKASKAVLSLNLFILFLPSESCMFTSKLSSWLGSLHVCSQANCWFGSDLYPKHKLTHFSSVFSLSWTLKNQLINVLNQKWFGLSGQGLFDTPVNGFVALNGDISCSNFLWQ